MHAWPHASLATCKPGHTTDPCPPARPAQSKTTNIFALLEDQCKAPRGSDSGFYEELSRALGKTGVVGFPPAKRGKFMLTHFAGDVLYNTESFLEKNKDTLSNGETPGGLAGWQAAEQWLQDVLSRSDGCGADWGLRLRAGGVTGPYCF